MTTARVHEEPAPGWGTPHYHDARRTEGDHYAVVTLSRAMNRAELVVALDAERERGWELAAIDSISHSTGNTVSVVLRRIRD